MEKKLPKIVMNFAKEMGRKELFTKVSYNLFSVKKREKVIMELSIRVFKYEYESIDCEVYT